MNEKLAELKRRLAEIQDLGAATAILDWDLMTYMPPGGAQARARQLATLTRLAHEKLTDPAIGAPLENLLPYEHSLPFESDEASLLRVTRRKYNRAVRVPPAFAAELSRHGSLTNEVWARARPANDFKMVQPYLERVLELSRELANFFPGYAHIADPLIDFVDYGMTVAILRPIFEQLRAALVPLAGRIAERGPRDDSFLHRPYPEPDQLAFGTEIVKAFGYDFTRGRQDKTAHPFMTGFSINDVRITTRVKEDFLGECLFSQMHEAGHAIYEQGIDPVLEGGLHADGASSGVHESQSRLWENLVGRSRPFWQFYYPHLQQKFPTQLRSISLDSFYRAINKVQRSLIRTDADEVTYNLHVMIRFELELRMLEGRLAVKDLPEAWNTLYREDLGIMPPDDRDGCLQDIHWFMGTIGGKFQCYTLGNILSALFCDAATRAYPQIPHEISQGRFATLREWLRENIHRHGAKFTAGELIQRITGTDLTVRPYLEYLQRKYADIYQF